ncbi:IS1595 family transposase [Edaphobacter modestus]|uniref:Transposase-like protein n=1 Tax=Edaphobacter modestus TaxID=388466 RepID=A0A4V2G4Y6_9BACT|nr:IS1595 family transposase [Edaphobacter modestus]RZU42826.1 transposase-like protein [Edaphobacter modestus]
MNELRTLQQAIVYFSDADRAFQYALNFRWPDGLVSCPRCGSEKHSFIKTRRIWFCYGCDKQFSLKVGTIFEDSAITLDKWMLAMWMLANCRNGVSSYELGRTIGVTQRSAWFMLHRIREAMKDDKASKMGSNEGGEVEVDEAYVGAKVKNMHHSRKVKIQNELSKVPAWKNTTRYAGKTPVMGIFDRTSREVRAKVVPNTRRETLQKEILNGINFGSRIYTDQAVAYDGLKAKYVHETVNHADEYVRGQVHTNCLENFWSLMKRNLAGTYVAVEPFHLDRYLDEQMFRFNNRQNKTDVQRFNKALSQVAGKRLTYDELTGAGSATSH